jgi:hypothetical protein
MIQEQAESPELRGVQQAKSSKLRRRGVWTGEDDGE